MRYSLLAAVLCLIAMPAFAQQDSRSGQPSAANDGEATTFIRTFFAAIDARDLDKIEDLLLPSAKVVHANGNVMDKQQLLSSLRGAKEFPPRRRELSNFEVYTAGKVIVVGFTNHVTFQPADRAPFEHTFVETWILERTDSGLKALRAHYSRIGAIENFGIAK